MPDNKCPNCKGTDFAPNTTGGFVCLDCGSIVEDDGAFHQVYPKCPNTECEYHTNPVEPNEAFAINVIEQGIGGKILKSRATNMISCVKCGYIVGVAGKG